MTDLRGGHGSSFALRIPAGRCAAIQVRHTFRPIAPLGSVHRALLPSAYPVARHLGGSGFSATGSVRCVDYVSCPGHNWARLRSRSRDFTRIAVPNPT